MKPHNLYGLNNRGLLKLWKKEPLLRLSTALQEARVKVADVGARGGAIKELMPFAPFIHYLAIEPEQKARSQLQDQLKAEAPWKNVTTVPNALGLANAKPSFHTPIGNFWLGSPPHSFQFEFLIALSWHRHTSYFLLS